MRRPRRCVPLLGALTAVGLAGCGGGDKTASTTPPVSVRVAVRGIGTHPESRAVVNIRVDGRKIPVVLDSGSSGLFVRSGTLPRGPSTGAVRSEWGDGSVSRESRALATVSIGGVKTATLVSVGLVHSWKCTHERPHCQPWATPGVKGILGIAGTEPGFLRSPLQSLPGAYGRSWRLALHGRRGTLELGAPAPAHPVARLQGKVLAAGAPTPTGGAQTCWQLGNRAGDFACGKTLIDSGSTTSALEPAGAVRNRSLAVNPGQTVSVWASPEAEHPFWRFTVGKPTDTSAVIVAAPVREIVASIAAFKAFAVTENVATNTTYLSNPTSRSRTGWRQQADDICSQVTHQVVIRARGQKLSAPRLSDEERRYRDFTAYEVRLALAADTRLAGLAVPRAQRATWRRIVRAFTAGDRLAGRFGTRLTSYRSRDAFDAALRSDDSRLAAIDHAVSARASRLGVTGCSDA